MRRLLAMLGAVALCCAAWLGEAWRNDALAASATGTASATILRPLAVRGTAPLRFGTLRSSAGGSVVIGASPPHERAGLGDIQFDEATAHGAAAFEVAGEVLAAYRILLPDEALARAPGIAAGLLVHDLQAATPAGPGETGRLGADGTDRFWVGGRLEVPPGTARGSYAALIEVLVVYQ